MLSYLFEEFFGGERAANHVKVLALLLEGSTQQFGLQGIPRGDNDGDRHEYELRYLRIAPPRRGW
jgi:hypothetical protein